MNRPPENPSSHLDQGTGRWIALFVRVAVAAGFLSAVADRFGFWGPPGSAEVAWGDFPTFSAYAAKLNPWASTTLLPVVAWTATVAETVFAILLLIGWRTRWVGAASGLLLLGFALGMTIASSVKSPLDASVFAAAAAALSLVALGGGALSIDEARKRERR